MTMQIEDLQQHLRKINRLLTNERGESQRATLLALKEEMEEMLQNKIENAAESSESEPEQPEESNDDSSLDEVPERSSHNWELYNSMDISEQNTVNEYKEHLQKINHVLATSNPTEREKATLLGLKEDITQLLSLRNESPRNSPDIDDEYSRFQSEIAEIDPQPSTSKNTKIEELKKIEGKKYRAPHTHQWGQTVYHNAMVSSILPNLINGEIKVKVLFLNPTHKEMLPCPYFFNSERDCKFSEENCRYSHGETVLYSSLQEYVEPNFENLIIGSRVLAKQKDSLWGKAKIRSIGSEHLLVHFEANNKKIERVLFENIHPIEGEDEENSESDEDMHVENDNDIINMSLLIKPLDTALGDWEKYTKGIGSKLMQKMGYIIGTGLGKDGKGRIQPVTAVVLPQGKSLDHCMNLREKFGGDKDFFNAEKKMKKMQKRQEILNKKAYERESKKIDVFSFMNAAFSKQNQPTSEDIATYKESLKKQSMKDLNVSNLVARENIKKTEDEVLKYKESLKRVTDQDGRKVIMEKISAKEEKLRHYQTCVTHINNEQNLREQKRKMTVF